MHLSFIQKYCSLVQRFFFFFQFYHSLDYSLSFYRFFTKKQKDTHFFRELNARLENNFNKNNFF